MSNIINSGSDVASQLAQAVLQDLQNAQTGGTSGSLRPVGYPGTGDYFPGGIGTGGGCNCTGPSVCGANLGNNGYDLGNSGYSLGNSGISLGNSNNSIDQLLTGMAGGTSGGYGSTGGTSGGTGGILAKIAEALGAAADNQMNQMSSLASQIGNVSSSNQSQFASLSGELNAAGQQFGIISQATNTVLNAIGSGEEQLARKS